jgi:dTDP-4-dehydrorhamnose reductase
MNSQPDFCATPPTQKVFDFPRSRVPERWLVTGASGQLGRHVLAKWNRLSQPGDSLLAISKHGANVASHTVLAVDITAYSSLTELLNNFAPTRIVHLAGVSRPTESESNASLAWALHVEVTRLMTEWAAANNAWLFFASSDFVLSGRLQGLQDEKAPVGHETVYTRTKLAGEQVVLQSGTGCAGRLGMLWGLSPMCDGLAWGKLLYQLQTGTPVHGVTDELRTPLRFDVAADMIIALASVTVGKKTGYRGLINLAGARVISPYSLICHLRDQIAPGAKVIPVSRAQYSPTLPRPANASLDTSLLRNLIAGVKFHAPATQAINA